MRIAVRSSLARGRYSTSNSGGSSEPVSHIYPIENLPRYRTRSRTTLTYDG